MDPFIARMNVKNFTNRLRTEADPGIRARLHRLLLEEEDRLGRDLELLIDLERTIAGFDTAIQTQTELVASFEQGESDSLAGARRFLDGLVQSRTLCKDYHRRLVNSARTTD